MGQYDIIKVHKKEKHASYALIVCIGLLSAILWALNNVLYIKAYSFLPDYFNSNQIDMSMYIFAVFLGLAGLNDLWAAIFLIAYNVRTGLVKHLYGTLKTQSGVIICLAAIIGGPIGQTSYFAGIALAGPAYALTYTAMYPIIGCLLSYFILKQTISWRMWVGIIISVLGVIVISYGPAEESSSHVLYGTGFACLAAFAWALEIVLAAYSMAKVLPELAITIREITSGVILCSISLTILGTKNVFATFGEGSLLFYISLAGIAAGISYGTWYYTNNKIGCARGMVLNSTYVVWGIIINVFLGNVESISASICLGAICVFVGSALVVMNPLELLKKYPQKPL